MRGAWISVLFAAAALIKLSSSQQQQTVSCLSAGLYYLSSSPSSCQPCPAGSYCPEGQNVSIPCPPGQFQEQKQQSACIDCPENYNCSASGIAVPQACPLGRTNPAGSPTACGDCDYESYYYNTSTKTCMNRTVFCNLDTHYEVPTPLNRTQERTCKALTACQTVRLRDRSPIDGSP